MGGSDVAFKSHAEVYVSTIAADGQLGPWQKQSSSLPTPLSGAAAVVHPANDTASWIYVLGGTVAGAVSLDTVYSTTLHHDTGLIDPWIESTIPLSIPTHYLQAVALNNYLYVVGGYAVEGPPMLPRTVTDVYYAAIDSDGSLGPWQPASPLPEPLSSHLVVAYRGEGINTLYAIGGGERPGLPADASFHVYFADINPDPQGFMHTVGLWSTTRSL
jgi:hypothetical protein